MNNPMVPHGMLPSFLSEAFGDLYEEDGLLCLGQGLQWLALLAVLCRFYGDDTDGHQATTKESPDPDSTPKPGGDTRPASKQPPLVLVLGLKEERERRALLAILQSWGTPSRLLPTMLTNESGLVADRVALYQRGGIVCVTSRILIVDLLTGTVSSHQIQGLLMAHAHTVTEQSTEAFILRIYQSQRQQRHNEQASAPNATHGTHGGFVKAITNNPDALMAGFAQVDKILKALHVRKLYLYPRFHATIRDELEAIPNAIDVTELHPTLSKHQTEIQSAIAVLVMQCLRQLKQQTAHLVSWTNGDAGGALSIENCVVYEQFDRAVSRQLEPQWHRLSPTVKQLVQDLRTLRTLFYALVQYDCVAFWKLLTSLRTMSAASRHASLWLLEAATNVLFAKAKERVYRIQRPAPTAQIPNPVGELVTVLEENPKWRLLKTVLSEIRQQHEADRQAHSHHDTGVTNILVMVQDDKTLDALKSYLANEAGPGGNKTLQYRWLRFLEQCNDRSRSMTEHQGGTGSISEESRLLLEAEGRARRILFGDPKARRPNTDEVQTLNHVPAHVRKRRRIATEKGRGGAMTTDDLDRQAVLEEAVEATEHDLDVPRDAHTKMNARARSKADNETQDPIVRTAQSSMDRDEEKMFRVSFPDDELRIVLHSYTTTQGDQGHLLLQDIRPKHVILFDCDVAFIRAVEIYAALSAQAALAAKVDVRPIRVVFIMFEASAEDKNFKKALEREQNAFERLIHHKKTMPPPALQLLETQEMQQALHQGAGLAGTYMGGTLPLSIDTRQGRGKVNTSKDRRDVAVDVREFRSVLPSILHQGGMRLAPATLTVGDFVLSNVHCVERKSISDLFGSFASGRLYTQAEAMSKYYKCPCLLIEFDVGKAFCLQNSNELGVEIRTDSVCSKMALLTMHFPKLRLLWSRSPHETLKIFRDLKANHDEVDVDRAIEIGRSESEELLLHPEMQSGDDDEINETARAMLLRLPGVNVHSARRIMQECDSLADLSEMSREDLRRIAGPVTGQKLFTFFRQKIGAT